MMKRYGSLLAVTLLMGALLLALNWRGQAQNQSKVTWEYKVVEAQYRLTPPSVSERDMNKLGAEGWELVGTRFVQYPQGNSTIYRTDYYFKRAR
jgi:hypothetical protein